MASAAASKPSKTKKNFGNKKTKREKERMTLKNLIKKSIISIRHEIHLFLLSFTNDVKNFFSRKLSHKKLERRRNWNEVLTQFLVWIKVNILLNKRVTKIYKKASIKFKNAILELKLNYDQFTYHETIQKNRKEQHFSFISNNFKIANNGKIRIHALR